MACSFQWNTVCTSRVHCSWTDHIKPHHCVIYRYDALILYLLLNLLCCKCDKIPSSFPVKYVVSSGQQFLTGKLLCLRSLVMFSSSSSQAFSPLPPSSLALLILSSSSDRRWSSTLFFLPFYRSLRLDGEMSCSSYSRVLVSIFDNRQLKLQVLLFSPAAIMA